MHGLINWSIQSFVCETYGQKVWEDVASDARLGFTHFEALMNYEDHLTFAIIDAASVRLKKPKEALLEDLGTFLCSHPKFEALRRLLRFGGDTFSDFLFSLEDMADRVHLAVPDLEVPNIELRQNTFGNSTMRCSGEFPDIGHVLVGILQVMADDYGALALFEHKGRDKETEIIAIQLLATEYAPGRDFSLTTGA